MEFITPGAPLYKFYGLAGIDQWPRFERLLRLGEIYLSKPSDFNDPFDCAPDFDPAPILDRKSVLALHNSAGKKHGHSRSERRRRAGSFNALPRAEKIQKYKSIGLKHVQNVGIFCMTDKRDHPLMWSHYGDKHSGVCVEFKTDIGLFQLANKVLYRKALPVYNLRGESREEYARMYLTKADFWDYESEYRLIAMNVGSENRVDALRGYESDHDLMSFAGRTQTHGIHQISSSLIASITFGCTCPPDTVRKVIESATKHGLRIPFYQAEKMADRFELRFLTVKV